MCIYALEICVWYRLYCICIVSYLSSPDLFAGWFLELNNPIIKDCFSYKWVTAICVGHSCILIMLTALQGGFFLGQEDCQLLSESELTKRSWFSKKSFIFQSGHSLQTSLFVTQNHFCELMNIKSFCHGSFQTTHIGKPIFLWCSSPNLQWEAVLYNNQLLCW